MQTTAKFQSTEIGSDEEHRAQLKQMKRVFLIIKVRNFNFPVPEIPNFIL